MHLCGFVLLPTPGREFVWVSFYLLAPVPKLLVLELLLVPKLLPVLLLPLLAPLLAPVLVVHLLTP